MSTNCVKPFEVPVNDLMWCDLSQCQSAEQNLEVERELKESSCLLLSCVWGEVLLAKHPRISKHQTSGSCIVRNTINRFGQEIEKWHCCFRGLNFYPLFWIDYCEREVRLSWSSFLRAMVICSVTYQLVKWASGVLKYSISLNVPAMWRFAMSFINYYCKLNKKSSKKHED